MLIKNVVYHGDCVKVMSEFPEKSVDLVVTSPPYDSLRTYNGSLDWNFEVFKGIAEGLVRVLKDGGVIVWVVNDATIKGNETCTSFKQALYFRELGLNLHDTMIWLKNGGGAIGSQKAYTQNFEFMFVFSKGSPKTINLIKDAPNGEYGLPAKIRTGRRMADGTLKREIRKAPSEFSKRNNYWYIAPERGEHPAVFPLNLAKDHVVSWSNPGDTVLDPFAGSGTTLLACKQLNRDYVGIEKESIYKTMIDQRLNVASSATYTDTTEI